MGKHSGATFNAADAATAATTAATATATVQNAATECLSNHFNWLCAQVYLNTVCLHLPRSRTHNMHICTPTSLQIL